MPPRRRFGTPAPCRRPWPSTTGGSSLVSTRLRSSLSRRRPQVLCARRPVRVWGGSREWWLGRHDRVGDDDRCPRRRDHGIRDRRHRRRTPGCSCREWPGTNAANRRPRSISRPISRNWAAHRWPSYAQVPRRSSTFPATLEYLETRGVPVLAVGQADLPGFFARSAGIPAPESSPDVASAARVVATHLGLGLGSGILVCVPVPAADALPDDVAREAVSRAIDEAGTAGIGGPALTPWLLARIAEITAGASVRANTALIVNDARIGGELAVRLTER